MQYIKLHVVDNTECRSSSNVYINCLVLYHMCISYAFCNLKISCCDCRQMSWNWNDSSCFTWSKHGQERYEVVFAIIIVVVMQITRFTSNCFSDDAAAVLWVDCAGWVTSVLLVFKRSLLNNWRRESKGLSAVLHSPGWVSEWVVS